jgi:superfamily II DNA or RNA helicase/HKD family nuclease
VDRPEPVQPSLMPGVYDQLITRRVDGALRRLSDDGLSSDVASIEEAEQPGRLARHAASTLRRALASVDPSDRPRLIDSVLSAAADAAVDERWVDGERPVPPLRLLRSVHPTVEGPGRVRMPAPVLGLGQSDLLVNARGEPNLLHSLISEIGSADRIDLIVAFIKFSGLRPLLDAFTGAARRGATIRVLTTTYLGGTDARAIAALSELGAQVKVSYELGHTRMHAKGWLFERRTGFHTAYIGSSNLSHVAMTQGQEWNVRLAATQTPELVDKFRAAFEAYWDDPAFGFEVFDPAQDSAAERRLEQALTDARGTTLGRDDLSPFTIRPFPHQLIMLEDLAREREIYGRHRNLVVAATGTGKTAVAAFDYARLAAGRSATDLPRLLFVAHRVEILEQSRRMFRHVLRSGDFGELLVGDRRPRAWDQVFASIQSLTSERLQAMDPAAFDMVVVDEFHHAAAPTYRALLDRMRPAVLLGLTATPERLDGRNVLDWFEGHTATELRLWDALEQKLLSPFHYYGVGHESLDFRSVRWSAGRYVAGELDNLLTGDDVLMSWVIAQVKDKVCDPHRMRALAFASTVPHAHFVAESLSRVGIRAVPLDSRTSDGERRAAVQNLRSGVVQVIVTVDLFNEGVDVPEVDTVLMLRPTESVTVFLQQLGRGLRLCEGKDVVTVLDFIGFQDKRFRFDLRFRALTGVTRQQLTHAVQDGFPYLPAGSFITLDRVAQDAVLENIRANIPGTTKALVDDVQRHAADTGRRRYRLGQYLADAVAEPADVYGRAQLSWTEVCRRAGLDVPDASPDAQEERSLLTRVRALAQVDDLPRLDAYTRLLTEPLDRLTALEQRFATMLYFAVWPAGLAATAAEGLGRLRRFPAVVDELLQVWEVARESIPHVTYALPPGPFSGCPLRVHARYGREEMLAGLGWAFCGEQGRRPRGHAAGTREVPGLAADAFDITWQKTEKAYSPSTMYADHAISSTVIHWESPNNLAMDAPTTQRYVQHEARRRSILIFAREAKAGALGTQPLMFLGPATYVSHEGSRPVAFRWRLHRPMPTQFFESARVMTA